MSARLTAALLAAALLAASPARADGPSESSPENPPENPPAREVPDYDGRPEPDADPADAALWVPRILTGPLYLISEYLLRAPLGFVVTELERSRVFEFLFDVFVFGPDRNIGVLPTAFFDFGLAPSAGVFMFWNGFLADQNQLTLHAATGGLEFLMLTVRDRWRPSEETTVAARFQLLTRPDQQLGRIESPLPAAQRPTARYGVEQIEGGIDVSWRPWGRNLIGASAGYRGVAFLDRRWREEDRTVREIYGPDALPDAYATGFSSLDLGVRFVIDSRPESELSQGGVRVEGHAIEHIGFGGVPDSSWVSWGASAAAATDVLGRGRVFGLTATVRGVSPVGEAIVPFVDLPELGGVDGPLPGFQPGLVRGRSLAALVFHYTWPLHAFLDSVLHYGLGNVFGDTFTDFDVELARMSFGLSIAPRFEGTHLFELGLAFGTRPFRDGANIESVRFVVGARNGL